jgi:hypothetical protein
MSVSRRISSLLIATSLLSGFFFVFFPGQVIAAEDNQNLSGIVWQSDGRVPTQSTDYCIWVERGPTTDNWYRFPRTGWRQTQQGEEGWWYYMYVLPYSEYNSTWLHGDIYRIQVDGTPWDDAFGNTTSNGSGSPGDPFPTPYDPQNPSNFNNAINYSVGGGESNEQQWDVRTTAQVDLVPENVVADGKIPTDYPSGIPVPPDTTIDITFDVKNYGSSNATEFYVSVWTCDVSFSNDSHITTYHVPGLDGSGTISLGPVTWISPSTPGSHYINITVDSRDNVGDVAEFNEDNNRFEYNNLPLQFIIGPNLILSDISVNGDYPPATINVPPNRDIQINAATENVGNSSTGIETWMAIYEIPGPGGPIIPGTEDEINIPLLNAGEKSSVQTWFWRSPNTPGDFYVNLSVDFRNDTWESKEYDNNFTIHFHVSDEPWTNIISERPRYPDTNLTWIYINSASNLWFDQGGFNPPWYTFYRINWTIDDTQVKPLTNYSAEGPFFTMSWGEGTYNIDYYSIDSIGTIEPLKTKTLIVDDTPPDTSITIGDDKYREFGNVWNITSTTNFSLSAVDLPTGMNSLNLTNAVGINDIPESGIYYRIMDLTSSVDVVPLTEYTPGTQLFLTGSDGYYRIFFNSTDNLMQIEPENYVDVYLDNSPPTIEITGGPDDPDPIRNKYIIDFSVFFNFTVDDGMGSGVDYTEYRVRMDDGTLLGWQSFTGTSFNLTEADHGFGNVTIFFRAMDNLGHLGISESREFYIEGDQTPPLPPLLSLRKNGNNIILEWEPATDAQSLDVHHYLIYRSATKKGFDFETPWVNTASMDDNGQIPLRTSWNDTNVLTQSAEYYYAIRGVDALDNKGYPSNIAGWVTMTFNTGYNTFALPLEPFSEIWVTDMLLEDAFTDERDTVYMYDTNLQMWIGHPKFLPASMNNFTINMGEGYMIYVVEDSVEYTFLGSSAMAIRFMDGPGSDPEFRDSLDIDMNGDNVILTWDNDEAATGYKVYRADTRMGPGSLTDYETLDYIADLGLNDTYYQDSNATGNEHYYMVVAESGGQEASSTYSLGVRIYNFGSGYSSFSYELDQEMELDTIGLFARSSLASDSDTIFYYDRIAGYWQGHPKFLPENINTGNVVTGVAYLIFTNNESAKFAVVGV